MSKLIIIDNYDSFTYNLAHYIEEIICDKITIIRNNEINIEEIANYDGIILSPGPGLPKESGMMNEIISRYASEKIILGVCLGMQAIAEHFGAKLQNLNKVYHGVQSSIKIISPDNSLFANLPKKLNVGRYHSWVVDKANFSTNLEITSEDENGYIMSLRHKDLPIHGVQFHPESILTPDGKKIIFNFIKKYKLF